MRKENQQEQKEIIMIRKLATIKLAFVFATIIFSCNSFLEEEENNEARDSVVIIKKEADSVTHADAINKKKNDSLTGKWEIIDYGLRNISGMTFNEAKKYVNKVIEITETEIKFPFSSSPKCSFNKMVLKKDSLEGEIMKMFSLSIINAILAEFSCQQFDESIYFFKEDSMIYEIDGVVFLLHKIKN